MAIPTFFSLSPLIPYVNSYDPANPNAPYVNAYLNTFGGTARNWPPWRLANQHSNDEIIVGWDAVPVTNQDLYAGGDHPYRRCVILVTFRGFNVSTENQYLLLFELRGMSSSPSAQFFVGTDLVDTLELTGVEQHAILLDCPGHAEWVYVYIRLASPYWYAAMGFHGVDCYRL